MKKLLGNKQSTTLKKNLLSSMILFCVPIIIIAVSIRIVAVQKIEKNFLENHFSEVQKQNAYLDSQIAELELLFFTWGYEIQQKASSDTLQFINDRENINTLSESLLLLENSNSMIRTANLLVDDDKPFMIGKGGSWFLEKNHEFKNFVSNLPNDGAVCWKMTTIPGMLSHNSNSSQLTFIQPVSSRSGFPKAFLLCTLDKDKIKNFLRLFSSYNENSIIFEIDHERIVEVKASSFPKKITLEKNKQLNKDKGKFNQKIDGKEYSIAFERTTRLNNQWLFISIVPTKELILPFLFLSNFLLCISLILIIIAAFSAIVITRQQYKPISQLMQAVFPDGDYPRNKDEFQLLGHEWEQLSLSKDEMLQTIGEVKKELRDNFLLKLLEGKLHFEDEIAIRKKMTDLGWDIESKHYQIIDVQLVDRIDLDVIKFANQDSLSGVMLEHLLKDIAQFNLKEYSIISVQNMNVIIFVLLENDTIISNELFNTLEEYINNWMNRYVSITVSQKSKAFIDIDKNYSLVERYKSFRNIFPENQLIFVDEEFLDNEKDKIQYPYLIEKEIIHVVRNGDEKRARECLLLFLDEVKKKNPKQVLFSLCVKKLVNTLQFEFAQKELYNLSAQHQSKLMDEIEKINNVDEVEQVIWDYFLGFYLMQIKESRDVNRIQQIRLILDYINVNYSNPDISLESCADLVDMDVYILSKKFKEVVGEGFIEYLTSLRIEKAKTLLEHSDMPINEIAASVGYQNSYFNRLFKKKMGITPGQYRKQKKQTS